MNKFITIVKNETFKKYIFITIAIILIGVFCVSLTPITLQNDTFYNIKIGELISKNGIDMKDHFSWHENLSYPYPHWLYDLLSFFVYNLSGFEGIYIVTCILSCILGISLYLISSKLSKSYIISFITTIGALYMLKDYITARAQLVTFILFVFTLYCIEMFLKNRKLRYAFSLILMSLLIANLHCAVWPFFFILFLPYIGEYFIGVFADFLFYKKLKIFLLKFRIKLLEKSSNAEKLSSLKKSLIQIEQQNDKIKIKRDKDKENPYKLIIRKNSNIKWLIIIMIICVLMGFLTPIKDTPFTYLIKTVQGNTTENINEHLPMTLSNQTFVLCSIVLFLSILIFTKVKINLADLFMLGGLAYLMLTTKRQESVFAIICSIILAKLIVNLFNISFRKDATELNKLFSNFVSIVLLTILVGCFSYFQAKDKFDDKLIDEKTYPVKACDFILENIDLGKAKFYNEYNYGSYLLFRGIPVFIDSRADLYAPEFSGLDDDIFMDFIDTSNIGKFYGDIFDKYGITHVILYKNAKVNMIIEKTQSEFYNKLYSDKNFVVYERLNTKKD